MSELEKLIRKIYDESVKLEEELKGKKGTNGAPDIPSLDEQIKEITTQIASGKISPKKGAKELKRISDRKAEIEKIEANIKIQEAELTKILEEVSGLNKNADKQLEERIKQLDKQKTN